MEQEPARFEPRHPIGVVCRRARMKPDRVRAWERRYGVVEPRRSGGNQRLYSDADIERLVADRAPLLTSAQRDDVGREVAARFGGLGSIEQLFDDDAQLTETIVQDLVPPRPGVNARQRRAELEAAALAGDTGSLERLVTGKTATDRAVLETSLFDRGVPRAARQGILTALARAADEHSLALLAACLRQPARH